MFGSTGLNVLTSYNQNFSRVTDIANVAPRSPQNSEPLVMTTLLAKEHVTWSKDSMDIGGQRNCLHYGASTNTSCCSLPQRSTGHNVVPRISISILWDKAGVLPHRVVTEVESFLLLFWGAKKADCSSLTAESQQLNLLLTRLNRL